MKIEDFGFITCVKKYEENSLLVKVLSKENGLISGYVSHVKKDRNTYSAGNLVKFIWSAKNTSQLGSLKLELVKSYLSNLIQDRFYLHLMDSINFLINNLLYERYPEDVLFTRIEDIFELIKNNISKNLIIKEYLMFENTLLNIVGTGIIFEDNHELQNLCYISPKTGLAVCQEKGGPYKDRLLTFPSIFKEDNFGRTEILEAFDIMDFFLKKHLNENNHISRYKILTISRENLLNNI